jgi:propanol-preferring alcohol dehydrogenase
MLVPSDRLLIPLDDLDPVDAAPLTDAALTPYHAIKRSLSVLVPGSSAVVIGAGGLGHLAVQLLDALSPARVLVVDQRQAALDGALAHGADGAVLAGPDAVSHLQELTEGRGAELVLDLVGSDETLTLAATVARPLGHLTIVGIAGGTLPVGFFQIGYEVSVATTYWGTLPELHEVVALARAGAIRPQVQRFTLDEAPRAYEEMAAGALQGRAVVVPDRLG